jgi:predicted hydrocarbon binding protein
MSEEQFIIAMFSLISAVGLSLAIILGTVGRALGRRIEGRTAADPKQIAMLEDLVARVEDMTELRREVGELQERVDFAERLLAQRPDVIPLPGRKA